MNCRMQRVGYCIGIVLVTVWAFLFINSFVAISLAAMCVAFGYFINKIIVKNNEISKIIASLSFSSSFYISYVIVLYLSKFILLDNFFYQLLLSTGMASLSFPIYLFFLKKIAFVRNRKSSDFILFSPVFFILFEYLIFIPTDVYFSNPYEFRFSYFDVLAVLFPVFITALYLITIVSLFIPAKVRRFITILFMGISFNILIQNSFGNKYIGALNGRGFELNQYRIESFINCVVWIAIFIAVLGIVKKCGERLVNNIILFLSLTHVVSALILIIGSINNLDNYTVALYDGEEQYVVGNDNVIVLVLDAVDNRTVFELLENRPELFDEFNDFTLYDNTCSVYDLTTLSMPQMFTGYKLGSEKKYTDDIYGRIKDNGYRINFYNYEADLNFPDINCYIDNYVGDVEIKKASVSIDYDAIMDNFAKLSAYKVLPYYLKTLINTNNIDFQDCINNQARFRNFNNYRNSEFEAGLDLSLSAEQDKYFIMQHINGAHVELQVVKSASATSLNVASKYIKELKSLGVYDNSTIILVADHGTHDDINHPEAGTPLLMIKQKGSTSDKMLISNAPVYHDDLMATILDCMELYDSNNDMHLGRSIFDIDESEIRKRTWYDTCDERKLKMYQFTYEGDMHELERVVSQKDYKLIDY